jgi:hypothetical protein
MGRDSIQSELIGSREPRTMSAVSGDISGWRGPDDAPDTAVRPVARDASLQRRGLIYGRPGAIESLASRARIRPLWSVFRVKF